MVRYEHGELFINGLKLFALLVAYIGVPLFVRLACGNPALFFLFWTFEIVAFFPIAVAGFFSPYALASCPACIPASMKNLPIMEWVIVRSAFTIWKHLALPIVTFWGVL